MREIKYRGQKERTKEWVYGSVVLNQGLRSLIVPTGKTYYSSPLMIHEGTWVYTETISQFTGLKDKNGHEIYEGDIIECVTFDHADKKVKGEVFYDNKRYRYSVQILNESTIVNYPLYAIAIGEVIGDIY